MTNYLQASTRTINALRLSLLSMIVMSSLSSQAEVVDHHQPASQNAATQATTDIQPSTARQTNKTASNGQEYYNIPNKNDDFEPLPTPEPLTQPDIVPMPTYPKSLPMPQENSAKTSKQNQKPDVTSIPAQNPTLPSQPITPQKKSIKEKIVPTVKNANLKFANFPVKVYTGTRVAPKIATLKHLNSFYGEALKNAKGEKQFIQTLSKTKPNYAGHYVVTSFACGLNCSASVAYDVKNGEFMELGGGFADCPATDFNPRQKASITHQANSRLMIVIGATSNGSCMAGYFEEKNGNVILISQKNLMNFVDTSKQIDYRF